MDKRQERTARKKYGKPSVISYGEIRQVTLAIGMTAKNADGGTGQTNKTG
jgi:hypothetical protein